MMDSQYFKSPVSRIPKKQVLLCGTQYGQTYLHAIDETKDFEVCALLAKGSDRSVKLSEQRAVNLYTHVEQIDEPVDLACVAIGKDIGTHIATALLEKDIPVLIEHPISVENSLKLLNTAKQRHTACHVNSHFSAIYPIAGFIELCQKLNAKSTPNIIILACNSRTLFSMLDILMRCFGLIHVDNVHATPIGRSGIYENCTLSINDIPCSLVYQKWRGRNDDSKDSPLGHEITITYPEGVLRLGGTFGPCQWFPLVSAGIAYNQPIYSEHRYRKQGITNIDVVQWRKEANKQAIQNLYESQLTGKSVDRYQTDEYIRHLSQTWAQLFSLLGTIEANLHTESIDMTLSTTQSIMEMKCPAIPGES